MKRHKLLFKACILVLLFQNCDTKPSSRRVYGEKKNISFTQHASGALFLAHSSTPLIKLKIEIADDDYERARGLMYRKSISSDQAMLFIFKEEAKRSFWMKNTRIALDILFLDKEQKIVDLKKNLSPYSTQSTVSKSPAMYVLELKAGVIDSLGIDIGARLAYKMR